METVFACARVCVGSEMVTVRVRASLEEVEGRFVDEALPFAVVDCEVAKSKPCGSSSGIGGGGGKTKVSFGLGPIGLTIASSGACRCSALSAAFSSRRPLSWVGFAPWLARFS